MATTNEQKGISNEKLAEVMVSKISADYNNGVGMQDLRRKINELIVGYSNNMTPEDKKEFAQHLRAKFERLRQFAEASYTEVLSATSSYGW